MGADSVVSMSTSASQLERIHKLSWPGHVGSGKRLMEDDTIAVGSWTDGAGYAGESSKRRLEVSDFTNAVDESASTSNSFSSTNTFPTSISEEAHDLGQGDESLESSVGQTESYVCQDSECRENHVEFRGVLHLRRHLDFHLSFACQDNFGSRNVFQDRGGARSDQQYFVSGITEYDLNHVLSESLDLRSDDLTRRTVSSKSNAPPTYTCSVIERMRPYAEKLKLNHKNFLKAQIPSSTNPIQAYNDLMELVVLPWCGRFAKDIIGPHIITHKLERGSVDQKLIFVSLDPAVTEYQQDEMEQTVRCLLLREFPQIGIELHKGKYGTAARNHQGLGRFIAPDCPGGLHTTLGPSLSLLSHGGCKSFLVTRHGMAAEKTVDKSTYQDNVMPNTPVLDISSGKRIGITLELHSIDPYHRGRVSSHPICERMRPWLSEPIKMRSDWAIVTDEGDHQKPNELACNEPESHCNHVSKFDRITPEDKFQYVGATSRVVSGSVNLGPPVQIDMGSPVRAFQLTPDNTLVDIRGDSGATIISQDNSIVGLVITWYEDQTDGKIFPMAMDMIDCLEDLTDKANTQQNLRMKLVDCISLPKCDCIARTICNCVGPWVEDSQNEDEISYFFDSLVNETVTSPVQSPSFSFVELGLSSADGLDAESRSDSPLFDIHAGSKAIEP